MSFIEKLIWGERIIKSPIFLKDFTMDNKQLHDLEQLSVRLRPSEKKDLINRDIAFLKKGIEGEKNVYYEIKNSFLPLLCLHDIRLKYENYVAQFDYILISNKFICVLETKMLNGNIIINSDGDFIRVFIDVKGKEIKREGMYSPISQNERHVNILKEILLKEKLVKTMPFISLVIVANPKTIIDKRNCPKDIEKFIYRYDQIIPILTKHQNDKENEKNVLEKYLYDIANFLITNNTPIEIDYYSKYRLKEEDFINTNTEALTNTSTKQQVLIIKNTNEENILCAKLKEYRLLTSKNENIAAYMIFNNEEMERLIRVQPKSEEELLQVKGFGKYGKDILKLINST